ncbi:DUF1236 domain-containing protein [Bradyrhizobium archetypum]|uniref:DUF1236 domain-containing protein n=1 Tax=Bradyrhizobium archetypum TaxID=2721160 RepID=A0A7Y4HA17_9BRAD|nr:DUF1236 domain-containing protein [Bradyrhizobium archetypum]NOJ49867.1 DUF1236 domain-containing protein [Bradyrhizobium archetypum]
MRKQLLLSTGIICLMLAPAVSYGQAPGARGEEQKQMRPSDSGRGGASQERGGERAQERGPAAEQRTQGAAGREERGAGSRQTEERGKAAPSSERPAAAADDSKRGRGDDAKSGERAQDSRQGGRDAQTAREGKDAKDSGKGSAEMKRDSDREKSHAESDKGKEGTTAQKEREGTGQKDVQKDVQKDTGRDQREGSKGAAEQGKDANRPSTATDTSRTQPSTNAQTAPGTSTTQTNQSQTTQSQTGQTQTGQQSGISVEKQERISQTLTRERLAPPERNLNISIHVGETLPRDVRVHRLPPEIVSIEPAYRDYDYFTTEEDIVIVEPRTHRIVSQIPRDASRIRAAGGGTSTGTATGGTGTMAAGGSAPCRIMRRDAAGNVTEVTPQTVGSTAQQESISVTVRMPGGVSTAPIPLGAPDGQIVVSAQGGADCMVTLEPQTR